MTITRLFARSKNLGWLRKNIRLLVLYPFVALILGIVGWSALFAYLEDEKRRTMDTALDQAAALARSYAVQIGQTMDALDQLSFHIMDGWEFSNNKLVLEKFKERSVFSSSTFISVGIVDMNGLLLTSTDLGSSGIALGDRAFFQVQKEAVMDSLYIGVPVASRVVDKTIIPFSRRLEDLEGNFAGVVVVAVESDYFTTNYDEITLGKNGLLGLVGESGFVRAMRIGNVMYPPKSPAFISQPYFESERGSQLVEGSSFIDKRSRFIGWDTIPRYSLIALTGLDEQTVLASYLTARANAITYAIWTSCALALVVLTMMSFSLRLAWRKHQLEMTQATYRMATEGGSEGFYIIRPIKNENGDAIDFEVIDSNLRGAELLRQRREELIGKRVSDLQEEIDANGLNKMLREAMESGIFESEVEVPDESMLTLRWVYLKIVCSDDDLALTLRDISASKAHVDELERQSNADSLTGLPNRHWMQTYLPKALKHAAEHNTMLAVLFIDLDRFKVVNDTAGHAAGDELLRTAAFRLKDAVRPHDQVVRLGGDEFLVILEHIAHKSDAAHVADRIQHAFQESFKLLQGTYSVGASIGICMFPIDGIDAETLLRNADVAMYSVKASGKGRFHFYDQNFYDALRVRIEREEELRHAADNDQFIVYYQPRVDVITGVTCSMEALVRWAHPTKGLLSPNEFIPLAEETGLILRIGELVVDKVFSQLAFWARSGRKLAPVSINVSPRQFNEVDVPKIFSTALARYNIDPGLVELELTESTMIGDCTGVSDALAAIRKMGIKLLVDDFGTGYSSLAQLQRMDFDGLKVDRAFTAEIEKTERGSVFFKAIVTMAHALGMRVVAEGVETERQIEILRSLECDELQGYYISKPIPPSDTQPILARSFSSSMSPI